ncbi:MAG: hypothetical protein IJU16_06380 [Clostridia bacterium]|nr:hypothetical protein [Clostridia bacterium]
MIVSAARCKQVGWLLGCLLSAALFLQYPDATAGGVSRGLSTVVRVLIPALFPFLVLSSFVVKSGLAHTIGRRISRPMKTVFRLPGSAAVAVLIGLFGGYPAGANAVAELLEGDQITKSDARRLLHSVVNAGPAFILSGVGAAMLGSLDAGWRLYAAHIAASLLLLLLGRLDAASSDDPPARRAASPHPPAAVALVDSVQSAGMSLLSMSGFVVFASVALALADATGVAALPTRAADALFHLFGLTAPSVAPLLPSIVEVSCGCLEAATSGAAAPFWLGAALGFGGLSVHGQIAVRLQNFGVMGSSFLRARIAHALLGGLLSRLLFYWFPPAVSAVAVQAPAALSSVDGGVTGLCAAISLSLLLLCALPPFDKQDAASDRQNAPHFSLQTARAAKKP